MFVWHFLLWILTFTAWAQADPFVHLQYQDGEVPTISIADTHQAQLMKKELVDKVIPIELEVMKNDCSFSLPDILNYSYFVKVYKFDWIWIKHPDAERLNQPARVVLEQAFEEELSYMSLITNHQSQEYILDLSADAISLSEKFDQIHVVQWSNQTQWKNPETDKIEQKLETYLSDFFLKPMGGGLHQLEFTPSEMYSVSLSQSLLPILPFLERSVWLVEKGGEMCEIHFKTDIFRTYMELSNYKDQDPSSTRPYVLGSDSWTELLKENPQIKNFSEIDGVYNVIY